MGSAVVFDRRRFRNPAALFFFRPRRGRRVRGFTDLGGARNELPGHTSSRHGMMLLEFEQVVGNFAHFATLD